MDSKILVYVAIGVIVAILIAIAILPNSDILKNMITPNKNMPSALTSAITEVKPLEIQYNGSKILSVTDRDATLETRFSLTNPNDNTLIIEMVTYDVHVNNSLIGHGQYGQRYEGTWESSYYLPLTQHNSETITAKAELHNDGNNPQAWSALKDGTAKLELSGTTYYSTHSAFAGQSFSRDFNFTG